MTANGRRRILVPLDGSASAEGPLEIAAALAQLMDAELHALFVGREPLTDDAAAQRMSIPRSWQDRVTVHGLPGTLRAGHR